MPARSLLLVCDDTTWVAAGEKIFSQLIQDYSIEPYSLKRYPRPSLETANILAAKATEFDGIIAVGAGTINDLVKYAAFQAKKNYIAVATAASMTGYTSKTSSLEVEGLKQAFIADVPLAVVVDTNVIAAAPKRLARSGMGDTLCRSSVEADMLLSHLLLGTPYPKHLFDTIRQHEAKLIAEAAVARESTNIGFITTLMEALLDTGDATAEFGSSAPASQGEHMIVHALELMYESDLRNLYHGELIAVATLTMNHLQHKMLLSQPIIKSLPREAVVFERQLGKKMGPVIEKEYAKKVLSAEQVAEINARLPQQWPEIKAAISAVMTAPVNVERAFIQCGLSTKAPEIGISTERYRSACAYAYITRDRFGFLDLAAMNDRLAV